MKDAVIYGGRPYKLLTKDNAEHAARRRELPSPKETNINESGGFWAKEVTVRG